MLLGFLPTSLIMAFCALAIFWAWWQDRKPYMPGKLPFIPYPVMMYIFAIIFIIMAAHMIELYTGEPLKGRFSQF